MFAKIDEYSILYEAIRAAERLSLTIELNSMEKIRSIPTTTFDEGVFEVLNTISVGVNSVNATVVNSTVVVDVAEVVVVVVVVVVVLVVEAALVEMALEVNSVVVDAVVGV